MMPLKVRKKKEVKSVTEKYEVQALPKVKKERKPRIKKTSEAVNAFPTDARINDYGFLHFKTRWLEDLNWHKGMALKVEKNADGSITVRKA